MGLQDLAYTAKKLVKAKDQFLETSTKLLLGLEDAAKSGYAACQRSLGSYSEELLHYLLGKLEDEGFSVGVRTNDSGYSLHISWSEPKGSSNLANTCYSRYIYYQTSKVIQDTLFKAYEEPIKTLAKGGKTGMYDYYDELPLAELCTAYSKERVLQELRKYFVVQEGTFTDVYIEWSKDV